MVEFVTFFLGILVGTHPVELEVSGSVAAVEILLDDRQVQVLHEGPWSFECDFGPVPEPHELVVIARDVGGGELDRTTQWINLGHQTVEARITLHRNTTGHPVKAEIDWAGIGSGMPQDIAVTFDGDPLEVKDPSSIGLPSYDMDDFHCLSATMRFSGQTVRAFASFGGSYGSEVKTELTAIPVVPDRGSVPSAKKLQSSFIKNGEPLAVQAVEKGPAEIVVVWDAYAHASIDAMTTPIIPRRSPGRKAQLRLPIVKEARARTTRMDGRWSWVRDHPSTHSAQTYRPPTPSRTARCVCNAIPRLAARL